jgi:hypothetical protein
MMEVRALWSALLLAAGSVAPAVELPFDRTCPVFHDNDDHRDVYTEEYLMALAHLGEIRLVGLTTTYAPSPREYELFVRGRAEIVAVARRSGLRNLPDAMPGTNRRLQRPASNRPEDTVPLDLPASRALVAEARKCTPEKPLVFLTGGQLTVVADAWLLAPNIQDRVVVAGLFGAPGRDYNASLDAWAWTIVMSKFRVFAVPFGPPGRRGTVFLKAAQVPKERIRAELPQEIPFFAWMFSKRHPTNDGPAEHDYDGPAAIALVRPDYITAVRRWKPIGIHPNGDVRLVQDDHGPVIEAVDADQRVATEEFWRTMHALRQSLSSAQSAADAPVRTLPPLRVSDNCRWLVTADGRPFFWLADTAWQLIHDLTREEVERYLADRSAKGFNVFQTVALAHNGLTAPNAYGRMALIGRDPSQPDLRGDNHYWTHVDFVVRQAAQHGLYVALLPTWGNHVTRDYFDGRVNGIFTVENAEQYGRFLGERYRTATHIVWILGGDRAAPTPESQAIWRAMARGIAIGVSGREDYSAVLMTYHPAGPGTSADYFHHDEWLDFNGIQSSHGPRIENWKMVQRDYARQPPKPVIDLETTYVEIVFGKQTEPLTDDMARRAAYWAVFSGAAGHTYGHNSIWQMFAPGKPAFAKARTPWDEALDSPSAAQMGYLRRLIESFPFLTQRPDSSFLVSQTARPTDKCLAVRGEGYALVYTPSGAPLELDLDRLALDQVRAAWFDPRTGETHDIGQFEAKGRRTFTPPSATASVQDWVLIVTRQ